MAKVGPMGKKQVSDQSYDVPEGQKDYVADLTLLGLLDWMIQLPSTVGG